MSHKGSVIHQETTGKDQSWVSRFPYSQDLKEWYLNKKDENS